MNDFNYFDAFANIIGSLDISPKTTKTISKEDYETFRKEYMFERLKGKTFGQAFCEKFDMDDYFLKNLSDKTAQYHIENLGYIK